MQFCFESPDNKKGTPQDAFFIDSKPDQTRLNSGLRTCCASAAEKNFSV